MDVTNDYYKNNADTYIEQTKNCDMSQLYDIFEKYLSNKKSILDIGFGSGRDSLYFMNKGYDVTSIDNCIEFVNYGKQIGLSNVLLMDINEMDFRNCFDSIWASASLLHIKIEKLNDAFKRCCNSLKINGIMYCSFKYGIFSGIRDGRYYIDLDEKNIHKYIKSTNFKLIDVYMSKDVREDNTTKWISFILQKIC